MNPQSLNDQNVVQNQNSKSNLENTLTTQKPKIKIKFRLILLLVAIVFFTTLALLFKDDLVNKPGKVDIDIVKIDKINDFEVKKFSSDTEFKEHIAQRTGSYLNSFGSISPQRTITSPQMDASLEPIDLMPSGQFESLGSGPDRVSETNVQVAGIDEPDIVKTDGVDIYYSGNFYNTYSFLEDASTSIEIERGSPKLARKTNVIKAFPPTDLKTISSIDESGEMLLFEDVLITFSNNKLSGYNVQNPAEPVRKWTQELDGNNTILSSRKYDDKLYIIAQNKVRNSSPCPVPLIKGGATIACTDIYYPPLVRSSDTTYTILIINPNDGAVEQKATFLGNSGKTVTYMSENYIYITFTYEESFLNFFLDFVKNQASDLFPQETIERLEKVAGYDISEESKMTEFTIILENYMTGLSSDEEKKLENEMQNKLEDYMKTHARDLEKSGIARFDAKNLKVTSSQAIPGSPLNQFSLDEYQGNLRIATTTSNSFVGSSESFNDIYILNNDLEIIGDIRDLGLTERIYSARFIEDRGYLVTFRRADPFYVLDLSDPKNPQKTGELKIPGYSSYLHPLDKNLILGVGQEGSNAKVSLFDASDPYDPKEISKYDLSEYWSEVSSNHHAFLQDKDNSIFFMPAGQNGYVFSYNNNVINLQKVVTGIRSKRALYLDNYLYILGDEKLVVLNEEAWEQVNSYDYK